MKSRPVWMMPVVALLLVASWGGVWADTSDVKGAAPVIVGKSGKHCKDDPHCFNYHFAILSAAIADDGAKGIRADITKGLSYYL